MKVVCDGCQKEYSIPDDKIPSEGGTFKCKECGSKIKVSRPTQKVDELFMKNKIFTFAKPYLSFIDKGDIFRKPFT